MSFLVAGHRWLGSRGPERVELIEHEAPVRLPTCSPPEWNCVFPVSERQNNAVPCVPRRAITALPLPWWQCPRWVQRAGEVALALRHIYSSGSVRSLPPPPFALLYVLSLSLSLSMLFRANWPSSRSSIHRASTTTNSTDPEEVNCGETNNVEHFLTWLD